MSDQIKPLPAGAQSYPSVQVYQKFCRVHEKDLHGLEDKNNFSLSKTRVLDTNPRDRNLELNYFDTQGNFYCAAQWSLDNHEMVTMAGTLEPRSLLGEGVLPMKDACSLYDHLVPQSPVCEDKYVSPELSRENVAHASTLKKFMEYCQEKLQERSQARYGEPPVLPLDSRRVKVLNPDRLDPYWFFRYESLGQDFFCEGVADFKVHRMHVRSGPFGHDDRTPYKDNFHMTDACSLTEALFGDEKYLGEKCVDKSDAEVKREYYTQVGFNLLVSGIAIFSAYKLSKGFISQGWRAASPFVIPLAKQAFTKTLPLWNAIYSFEGAAVSYFTSPLSKIGWAGRLGWAGVSFYAGYKAGGLVDQIPKIFGGKNISDYGADGLETIFGKPPGWMVDATDWVSDLF